MKKAVIITSILLCISFGKTLSPTLDGPALYTAKSGKVFDNNGKIVSKSCYEIIGITESEVKDAYNVKIQPMQPIKMPSKNIKPSILYFVKKGNVFNQKGEKIDKNCYGILGLSERYVKLAKYSEITQSLKTGKFRIYKEIK